MSGAYEFLYPTLEEMLEPEEGSVEGVLPSWLRGTLIRTGPGLFDFKGNESNPFTVNHFLDGYAMLTRFQISENVIKYDRKFLQTDAYKKAISAGCPVVSEFGTKAQKSDPTKSLFSRFLPSLIPEISDNCNISLFNIGKDVFAAADSCFFRQIDPSALEVVGSKFDTSKLFGLNFWSCHPMKDRDGYIYNIGTSFITGLKYNIVRIPIPSENETVKDVLRKSKILATVPSSHTFCASPCHSFGKTERFIIFIEQPLVIVAQKVLASILHKSCNRDFMEYRPELKNRFFIVEKATGKVHKTEYVTAEPFFFLHFINCYEEEDEIVVDVCAFPNANCIDITLKDFKNGFEGNIEDLAEGRRFVLPLNCHDANGNTMGTASNLIKRVKTTAKAVLEKKHITLSYEVLTEKGIEVPIVHEDYVGQKYKHFYGGGPRGVGPYKSSLCKFNVETKEASIFKLTEHDFLAEPLFLKDPNGQDEDDGVIISCFSKTIPDSKGGGVVFINAKTMQEIGRTSFKNFVPLAIHGIFIPEK